VPLELDPDDPLAELPGNPQSSSKRAVVSTWLDRVRASISETGA
jgi:hypothetical protein